MNNRTYKFDLHVHTLLSPCSRLHIDEIVSNATAKGLDGVCITDHGTMAIRTMVDEGVQDNGLCIIFGMEYTTTEGDFLVFGPFEELPANLPAEALLKRVEQLGGVAVAAHPFRQGRAASEHLIEQQLCRVVEGINGRNSHEENLQVINWQNRFRVRLVGGSDAHCLDELGQTVTRFQNPITSREELISTLKHAAYTPLRHTEQ